MEAKRSKRPCIAKRTISSKKMLHAIFKWASRSSALSIWSYSHWPILQEFCTEVKEFYNKKGPSKGWPGVHLLHDNASTHKCEVVKSFLASEKVKVLNHPPYSPDWSPCDFFLFQKLKQMLYGNKYTSRSSLAALFISVSNRYQKKTIYLFSRLGKKVTKMCFSKGEYFEGL